MEKEQLFIGKNIDSSLIAVYDSNRNQVKMYIHLNRISFRKRIVKGLRYIFGSEKNGHYQAFALNASNKTRMINLIRKLKDDRRTE